MVSRNTDIPVSQQISNVGADLSESFRTMFQQANTDPAIPKNLTKDFGTNSVFSHRLSTALSKADPLATMLKIPGPQPLRKVLKTAKRRGVQSDCIARANQAINDFEDLIHRIAGDRNGLDLIIGSLLPDESSRYESAAKQLVYRGMRQLKGIATDTHFETLILFPGEDPQRLSNIMLHGYLGYRRLRPRPNQGFTVHTVATDPHQKTIVRSIDNTPLSDNPRGIVMDQFCSLSSGNMNYKEIDDGTKVFWDWGDAIGNPSSCDLVFGERANDLQRKYFSQGDKLPHIGFWHKISVPSKIMILDILLAPGLFPDWDPKIQIAEFLEQNLVDPNDSSVFDIASHVESLGTGIERFRTEDIPRYTDILTHTFEQAELDPTLFRSFRFRMEYPIFGTQMQCIFKLPRQHT